METEILHISDTHLGYRQYKSDIRRRDFADAFEQAVDIAIGEHSVHDEGEVDAVIHTGDLFNSNDVPLEDVERCQQILQKLKNNEIPFYSIVGNHEMKLRTQFVDIYENANLTSRLDNEPTVVNDSVALYGIDSVRERSWNTKDFSLESSSETFNIVCMHELFSPPIPEHIGKHDLEETIERFDIDVDAMALGDYHKRCSCEVDGVEAWYPGSTERCAVDEENQRSVDLLTIKDGELERKRLGLKTREFVRITVDFGKNETFDNLKNEVEKYTPLEEKVVVMRLEGEDVPVTAQQAHSLLESYDVAVSEVKDERVADGFSPEEENPEDISVDVEGTLEERIKEIDVSETALDIENVVRDTSEVNKSGVEEETEKILGDDYEV